MAIQVKQETKFGFTAHQAYVRVSEIRVRPTKLYEKNPTHDYRIDVHVDVFASKPENLSIAPLTSYWLSYNYFNNSTLSLVETAYDLIKTEDMFAGSIDV